MIDWTPVPEPQTWTLPKAMKHNGLSYSTVTIGAPTSEHILKASAVQGASGLDITLRIIEAASAEHVPYDVLKVQPHWFNQQISDYMEEFVGAPAPDPLERWRAARREAMQAELKARIEAEAKAAEAARAFASGPEMAPSS